MLVFLVLLWCGCGVVVVFLVLLLLCCWCCCCDVVVVLLVLLWLVLLVVLASIFVGFNKKNEFELQTDKISEIIFFIKYQK